jgi:hypothetical protein
VLQQLACPEGSFELDGVCVSATSEESGGDAGVCLLLFGLLSLPVVAVGGLMLLAVIFLLLRKKKS